MTGLFVRIIPLICLCALLAGCGGEKTEPTQAAVETVETAIVETTEASVEPEVAAAQTEPVSVETEAATEETKAVLSANDAENLPVRELPEVSEGPCHFYDDAAIMGDSISYSLMVHHTRTKDFGDAVFLVRGSLGIHNTLNKQLSVSYQGQAMTPWDALAASGVKKVFIMMGMNDIGYYSIDDTMEKWVTFLGNIREKCPDLEIYIESMPPMWNDAQQTLLNNDNIDAYNLRLQEFAAENDCHFVDIAPYFKNSENGMAARYCGDLYVHMNETGTAAWATVLKAYAEGLEKETN